MLGECYVFLQFLWSGGMGVVVRSVYQGASRLLTLGTELRLVCFREFGECILRARNLSCPKNRRSELMSLLRLSKKR
jgi:hypothetical protein